MHVIVTGGSSGIGLAIARLAVKDGHRVSIIARNPERLQGAARDLISMPDALVHAVSADVTDPGRIDVAIADCESHFGSCDLLVASAGVVEPAVFAEMRAEIFRGQIETNLIGVVNTLRPVFPAMQNRGRGSIMIVSSGAALIGLPGYSAYCASKAALVAFTESIRCEARYDVRISIAFPPDTETPQYVEELPKRPVQAQAIMGVSPVWPVDSVAKKIYSAAITGRETVHFGWKLKALALFGPLLKPLIYRAFSRRV